MIQARGAVMRKVRIMQENHAAKNAAKALAAREGIGYLQAYRLVTEGDGAKSDASSTNRARPAPQLHVRLRRTLEHVQWAAALGDVFHGARLRGRRYEDGDWLFAFTPDEGLDCQLAFRTTQAADGFAIIGDDWRFYPPEIANAIQGWFSLLCRLFDSGSLMHRLDVELTHAIDHVIDDVRIPADITECSEGPQVDYEVYEVAVPVPAIPDQPASPHGLIPSWRQVAENRIEYLWAADDTAPPAVVAEAVDACPDDNWFEGDAVHELVLRPGVPEDVARFVTEWDAGRQARIDFRRMAVDAYLEAVVGLAPSRGKAIPWRTQRWSPAQRLGGSAKTFTFGVLVPSGDHVPLTREVLAFAPHARLVIDTWSTPSDVMVLGVRGPGFSKGAGLYSMQNDLVVVGVSPEATPWTAEQCALLDRWLRACDEATRDEAYGAFPLRARVVEDYLGGASVSRPNWMESIDDARAIEVPLRAPLPIEATLSDGRIVQPFPFSASSRMSIFPVAIEVVGPDHQGPREPVGKWVSGRGEGVIHGWQRADEPSGLTPEIKLMRRAAVQNLWKARIVANFAESAYLSAFVGLI